MAGSWREKGDSERRRSGAPRAGGSSRLGREGARGIREPGEATRLVFARGTLGERLRARAVGSGPCERPRQSEVDVGVALEKPLRRLGDRVGPFEGGERTSRVPEREPRFTERDER